MNTQILKTLENLEEAIEGNAYHDAIDITEALYNAYDNHQPRERLLIERAKTVERTVGEPDPKVSKYLDQTTTAALNRAGLSLGLGVGLAVPSERSSELVGIVADLHHRESEVLAASKDVTDVLWSKSIPAAVTVGSAIVSPSPVLRGQDALVSFTLVNPGDEPAEGVTVSAELSSGGDYQEDELIIDPVTTESVEFRFEDLSGSGFEVVLTATTDDLRTAEKKIIVETFSKSMIVELVSDHLHHLETTVNRSRLANRGKKRRILSRIDASKQSVSRAEKLLIEGRVSQCDSQLETASRQLGSLLNYIEGSTNPDREENAKPYVSLFLTVEETIDLLFDAQKASVEA
ncbi:hypothetical protein [Natronorarus salvus]|uniref:hypothetical protein n=1 Tax=Natronorarus salvus TaxID=3117733 RepID=UPI002F267354